MTKGAVREGGIREPEARAERLSHDQRAANAQRRQWRVEIPRSRRRSPSLDHLLALSSSRFEFVVAGAFHHQGFVVRRVGGAGDLSVDLIGHDRSGKTVGIQCKRYARTRKIGSPDIQEFIGMTATHHRVDRAIFVTTSDFTGEATKLAREHGIELYDGIALVRLIGSEPLTRTDD